MLTATFQHAEGIGKTTEQKLWHAGILSWENALSAPELLPLSKAKRTVLLPLLEGSQNALDVRDHAYFARTLPTREHWRALPDFRDGIAFLDIETNGGYDADDITVIGVYDGIESRLYVQGQNLEDFRQEAERATLWVTFFGSGFDIPFLKRRFPDLPWNQLHIDLCPALKRLGYSGGLKRIEDKLGVRRTPEVEGMTGLDAVHLWNLWRRHKNEDALHRLLAYNRADIENLALLLDFAYHGLRIASGFPGTSEPPAFPVIK
ncbi:MAG: ribonuclease H-like domain-containing protein [Armatimonadaceae bacterium]